MIGFSQGARRVMASAALLVLLGLLLMRPGEDCQPGRRRLMLAVKEGDGVQGNSSAW